MTRGRGVAAGLITPAIVGIGVALGCTLAWPLMAFQSMNLYVGLAHCEWILDRAYLLSIVATTVTLALCGIFHKQFDRLLGSALARYLFPIGMAVCTLLVLGAGNEGTVGTALVTAYGIGTGVFSALFLMTFGAVLGAVAQAIGRGHRHRVPGIHRAVLRLPVLWALESVLFCASMGPVAAAFLFYGFPACRSTRSRPTHCRAKPIRRPCRASPAAPLDLRVRPDDTRAAYPYELSRTLYVQMGQFASSDVAPLRRRAGLHYHADRHRVHRRGARSHHFEGHPRPRGLLPPYHHVLACRRAVPACADAVPPTCPPICRWPSTSARSSALAWAWILIAGLCRRYQTSCLFAFRAYPGRMVGRPARGHA